LDSFIPFKVDATMSPSYKVVLFHLEPWNTATSSTQPQVEEPDIYTTLQVGRPSRVQISRLKGWSWRWHGRLLPLLHGFQQTPDIKVNLRVLWNKALVSVDPQSLAYEAPDYFTYHMLPRWSRWILRLPSCLYPRWFHANIELRTVYLNQAVRKEIEWIRTRNQQPPSGSEQQAQVLLSNTTISTNKKRMRIQLIVLGGGYDTRSIRLLSNGSVDRVWELDLPQVVESKAKLLQQLYQEVPSAAAAAATGDESTTAIRLEAVDLNQLEHVKSILTRIHTNHNNNNHNNNHNDETSMHTILFSEAILMYLDKGVPAELLRLCGDIFGTNSSFVFADRFEEIRTTTEEEAGRQWLQDVGWELVDWLPKPGATRHMGIARRTS
jgi:hypothetical protein